ncbi:MAG: hypothetical protein HND53_13120 [Proteobacteria bacterium]|nr:hypothetical protein [Pseudomonadota bacterium]NOG61437.1 hypothetical protein [Pseudomonadota bacterium]
MADIPEKPDDSLPELDDGNLIKQIDELEALLAEKKAEAQAQETVLPRLNVGTDGIPVLVEAVTEEGLNIDNESLPNTKENDDQLVNDIIDKIDKEITEDLDELILMLKDSIIEEVKTRLLKELKLNKDNLNKK